jgi:hypothetical protein
VAFNANYLVYVDETLEPWIADTFGDGVIDMLVKKAPVEWHSSADPAMCSSCRHGYRAGATPRTS